MTRYRSILASRNALALADCLRAMRRGDDSTDAEAGWLFVASVMFALLPDAR